ncbi:MAG: DUF3795 domain-containing protein [Candidatus Bathyarchaeota archaeon]|nr:MAG: DUF3795 domain-containing protein [Candidatus Bathyarchaeum tardum]WNZ28937.1 MAG: DUF3795 domain-containing protein [Candidatus Bathyarchaeota archaeon]
MSKLTIYNMLQKIPDSLAPCGVYCEACPSFKKSCNGCGSENKNQKRKSKWSCKIRVCCFEKNNFNFCYECEKFPCKEYSKKLTESHKGDKKYQYRHELPSNLKRIKKIGIQKWLREQKTRWQCPKCSGTIKFYHYKCPDCGLKKQI